MLHSSNTVLRLTIKCAQYDLPESLLYFEEDRYGISGLFESGSSVDIAVGDPLKIELFTKNGPVEQINTTIIRKEFTNPDYGTAIYRYVFSPDLKWRIDPVMLDIIHYKSNKIYDYAVTDAVKALNNTITTKISNWTQNCTCGDEKI